MAQEENAAENNTYEILGRAEQKICKLVYVSITNAGVFVLGSVIVFFNYLNKQSNGKENG